LYPLNFADEGHTPYQWTGRLFKEKPMVLFGFDYNHFFCPYMFVLSKAKNAIGMIVINCEDRY
jgi:hypothetical protein